MNGAGFRKGFFFTRYQYAKNHYSDNRKGSPRHFLAYMEQGSCRFSWAEGELEIRQGEAFYIPMGVGYQALWEGEQVVFRSYGFNFFPEAEGKSFAACKLSPELTESLLQIPLEQIPTSQALGSFFSLLAQLLPALEVACYGGSHPTYEAARQYIQANPDCRISQVAEHCNVSESALYALFKKVAGKTPNDVRQQLLAQKAEHLLLTTDRPIQQISDELGFSSVSYFRKIMKKQTGKSPRAIRKTGPNL